MVAAVPVWLLSVFCMALPAQQKSAITALERNYALDMLYDARRGIKKHYYDPTFHGVDMEARYKEYVERIKGAQTLGEAVRAVAAYLSGLDDSHTFLIPPQYSFKSDYGYNIQMIGDACYVTHVRPGTDAAAKIRSGDQVLSLGGFEVNRKDFWALQYYRNALAPKATSTFLLRDPAGNQRQEVVKTTYGSTRRGLPRTNSEWQLEVEKWQRHMQNRTAELGDTLVWKLPAFVFGDAEVDRMIGLARKHRALILDLRGNSGGAEDMLRYLVGKLFNHEVHIGKRITRQGQKALDAIPSGKSNFDGQLVVIVDSESASASELLARVVQLEQRGTLVGDVSAGEVRESVFFPAESGFGMENPYGLSITVADLTMSDGKSLEKTGILPDVRILPGAQDLAEGRDPVLAKAAEIAGTKLGPAAAGQLFPFDWPPE